MAEKESAESTSNNPKRNQGQTINQLFLAGDHYKMGQQHGRQVRALRSQIIAAIDDNLITLSEVQIDIQSTIEEISETWELKARPTMDMLRGIADTLSLNWDNYFYYTIAPYILDRSKYPHNPTQGCTTWAAAAPVTHHNTPILAKNRDYQSNHHELQCLAWSSPANGYHYTYLTSAGSPGVFSSGMNEVGLAVADTYVSSRDIGPGLPRYTVMMELLEHHDNVESAMNYLHAIQHTGNGTLTLLDSRGDMAVFETGYSNFNVVHSNEGFVVSTNHFKTPQKRKHWIGCVSKEIQINSQGRYASVIKAIQSAKDPVDISWAKKLMTTHGGSFNSICRHPETDSIHSTTISSVIYLPVERQIHLANGFPCQSDYQKWTIN